MSISMGPYVATFARPGHDLFGRRSKDLTDQSWCVFINVRRWFRIELLEIDANYREFERFDDAKSWAIKRLKKLIEARQNDP